MKLTSILIIFSVFISSCETYHMSTQHLFEQVANPDITKKQIYVEYVPGLGLMPIIGQTKYKYTMYVKCYDKKEEEHSIAITPRTQIRITKKNGSKCLFYYSTIKIQDSIITGFESNLLKLKIEPIKLRDVFKVEIKPDKIEIKNSPSSKQNNTIPRM